MCVCVFVPSIFRRTKGQKQPGTLQVGERVEARYNRQKQFDAAVVTKVLGDGKYHLAYDDGRMEDNVARKSIEALHRFLDLLLSSLF
jgi:hypothetical protein